MYWSPVAAVTKCLKLVNFKCRKRLVSLRWRGQRTALPDPTGCPLPTTAFPPTIKASSLDLLPPPPPALYFSPPC